MPQRMWAQLQVILAKRGGRLPIFSLKLRKRKREEELIIAATTPPHALDNLHRPSSVAHTNCQIVVAASCLRHRPRLGQHTTRP